MTQRKLKIKGCGVTLTAQYHPLTGSPAATDYPLVVAIHGGTYTCTYFDVAGYSLANRAARMGLPFVAINRPGYADSDDLEPSQATIYHNAEIVNEAIGQLWKEEGGGARGVFIIGHSIGGATSVVIASLARNWPLLGIAISGVGMRSPQHVLDHWAGAPDIPKLAVPPEAKDMLMFGPSGTYTPEAPAASHAADADMPRQEVMDISFAWAALRAVAAPKITVPVHYRQGDGDALWVVNETEVSDFVDGFSASAMVDARMYHHTGHCIDFHRLGATLQMEQLAFALKCSVREAVHK